MLEIDFSEPRWLINYYHFIGAVSCILNSIGIYLLLNHAQKLGDFRYYLLTFLVCCIVSDFQVTYFSQFINLYPMIAGYCPGLLSRYFGLRAHPSLTLDLAVVVIQMECLLLCFETKHQSIASISNTHILPKPIKFSVYFIWIITPFIVVIWFSTLAIPEEEKFDYIIKEAPQYLQNFLDLPNFDIYLKTTSFILFFCVLISAGGILNIVFFACAWDILNMMAKLKLKISPVTYQKHREAVISIMVQFGTSLVCFLPPLLMIIIVLSHIGNAQVLIEITTAWFASHSTINMICLLIYFPPYRSFVVKTFRRQKSTKSFVSPVVVSVS